MRSSVADRRSRRAVTVAFLANGLAAPSFLVRVPDVRDLLELRESALGLVLAGLAVGVLIGLVLSGNLAAKHGSRRLTLGGALVMVLALPVTGLAPNPFALVAALVLLGAASATMDVGMNAQGVGVEARYGRSIMLGLHGSWSIGALLAALTGSVAMGAGISVTAHLAAMSAVIVVLTLLAMPGLDVEDRLATDRHAPMAGDTAAPAATPPRFALPRGPLLPLALVAFAAAVGEATANDWSGIHLADNLEVAPGQVGWGLVAATAAMTVIRVTGDRIVRRVGADRVVLIGGALAAAGYLTLAASNTLSLTLAAFAAVGAGVGVTIPLVFAAAGTRSESPAAGVAAVATVGYFAFVVGPPIVGLVADLVDLRASFVLVAVLIGAFMLRRHPELRPVSLVPSDTDA